VADGHYFPNVSTGKVKKLLSNAREGMDKVEVEEGAQVFPLDVSCPRCNHGLMDKGTLLDGYPSVRVTIAHGGQHGSLRLSCLYGSFKIDTRVEIPPGEVADFFCPHCHANLSGGPDCAECSAPMVPMIVKGGGVVQVCSRRGCRSHMLDLSGVNA
jgi:hypothetical protein